LYGKNPAKQLPPAPAVIAPAPAVATIPAPDPGARSGRAGVDPLGELATARSAPFALGADPFFYFVQAGAFRTPEDAEAQRAKLSLMGVEAKVTEREQSGRQVFRVRVGPFDKKEEADRQKERLDAGGVETALVRVQR
jgi:cell division protein FtsN